MIRCTTLTSRSMKGFGMVNHKNLNQHLATVQHCWIHRFSTWTEEEDGKYKIVYREVHDKYVLKTAAKTFNILWDANAAVSATDLAVLSYIYIWAAAWQNPKPTKIIVCQQNDLCTQRRLGSAWTSAQSEQSLRCLHEEATHKVDSEDSNQTGWMPRLIWVFAGHTSFCWFSHAAAQLLYDFSHPDSSE